MSESKTALSSPAPGWLSVERVGRAGAVGAVGLVASGADGVELLDMYLAELAAHAWDLARATGQTARANARVH